jgi:hypothetical protein
MSQKMERRGNVEVRLHADGTLDEILVYDQAGVVLFHLEQMDGHYFWMRAYSTAQEGHDLVAHISTDMDRKLQTDFTWEPSFPNLMGKKDG